MSQQLDGLLTLSLLWYSTYQSIIEESSMAYSPRIEAKSEFDLLCNLREQLILPSNTGALAKNVKLTSKENTI